MTMTMVPKSVARWEQANTAGPMAIAEMTVPNAKTNQPGTLTLHLSSPNKEAFAVTVTLPPDGVGPYKIT